MHVSDNQCFHIQVCYVSFDVLDSLNSEEVHRVVQEMKRKLFETEFHVGRSKRRVPRRYQNDWLDAIAHGAHRHGCSGYTVVAKMNTIRVHG
jgi:hypothetical protein